MRSLGQWGLTSEAHRMTGFWRKVNPPPLHFIKPLPNPSYLGSTIGPDRHPNTLVRSLRTDPVSEASVLSHTVAEVLPRRFEDQYDL
ncbi:MAG: hypothetical protein CME17_06565 [Gemmatimonadetes bacterium]|nr:hypothetical protein [Gemmatimonadota bacterium]